MTRLFSLAPMVCAVLFLAAVAAPATADDDPPDRQDCDDGWDLIHPLI